ncbi:hypothetical protein WJX79_002972 [Trebouxia sp. C0005]
MEGRSLNLDAKATSPFSQPKAFLAHQNGSPGVRHTTSLGTQDRQPPAAHRNLPPAPASGLVVPSHSQTVTNNMSGSASISSADHAQQGHTSTTWPAHFASSSAAITAPFSGPSMASVMRARPGSPPIKADSSSPVVSHVPDSPGLKAHPSIFAEAAPNGPGNTARSQSPAIRAVSGSPDFTSRAGQGVGHQPAAVQPHSSSLAPGPGPGDQPHPVSDPEDDQQELCQSSADAQTHEAGNMLLFMLQGPWSSRRSVVYKRDCQSQHDKLVKQAVR